MDQNSIKIFEKWVKKCKKLGLLYARMGEFEYQVTEIPKKIRKNAQKDDKIEGLVHDESAKMPNDSEMLLYSTPYFDVTRESRKNEVPIIK